MKYVMLLIFLSLTSFAQSATTYFFYSDTIEPNDVYEDIEVHCTDAIPTVIDMNGGTITNKGEILDFIQLKPVIENRSVRK